MKDWDQPQASNYSTQVAQVRVPQLRVAQPRVAQVFNLLYRRLAACRPSKTLLREHKLATLAREVSKLRLGGQRERRR
jgi:hypothetical protein